MKRGRKNSLVSLALLGALCLSACADKTTMDPDSLNLYGGSARTNAYEYTGPFAKGSASDMTVKVGENDSTLPGAITPPLPVGSGEICVGTTDGAVVRLLENTIVWKTSLAKRAVPAAALCGDAKGNIYVVASDGSLASFAADGKQRWRLALFKTGITITYSDLLAVGDGVVAAATDGEIVKVSFDGKVQWRRFSTLAPTKTFAADAGGNLYIALSQRLFDGNDSLLVLSPQGNQVWALAFEHTRLIKTPVVYETGVIVAGLRQAEEDRVSVLHDIDQMGRIRWSKELTVTPRGVSIAADGTIIVAGYRAGVGDALSAVIAYSPQGKQLWKMNYEFTIPAPVLISEGVLAFVGTKGKATGMYYMMNDGTYMDVVSMGDMPVMNLQPAVDASGAILFTTSENLGMIRVAPSGFNRILPF
jgi:outer membrane protein assembly factor BamB